MALDPSALVDASEARTFLGASETDDPKDELLELLINGLSARIIQRTGDLYVNPVEKDGASTRSYDFDPAERLVDIDNVRSITEVAVTATPQEADSWLPLSSSDYYSEPVAAAFANKLRFLTGFDLPAQGVGWGGLALHVGGRDFDSMHTPWPTAEGRRVETRAVVRVKGKFGIGADRNSVPHNVKLATLMWLQNVHRREIAFTSETIGVATATLKMPADVEELLTGETDVESTIGAI